MESALYGIYVLVFVSENSCVNTVRVHFHEAIYIHLISWCFICLVCFVTVSDIFSLSFFLYCNRISLYMVSLFEIVR